MITKNLSVAVMFVVIGSVALIACASPARIATPIVPTVAPPTIAPSATAPPTSTTSPTVAPSVAVPSATPAATAANAANNSIAEYVTALTGGKEAFDKPSGVIKDAQGNVYVLEGSDQILKYDKAGNFVTKWGSTGDGDGQFNFGDGWDIAIDSQGNLFITEGNNHRVQKFDLNGKFLAKWGKSGTGDGEFDLPSGIAVDSQGNVYMTDMRNNNVQVFDGNGKFLAKWGTQGDGPGQFNTPSDAEINAAGNVYVNNVSNGWIERFDSQGKSLGRWNECGPNQHMSPYGLALDRQGNVYVADGNSRICKFTADGKFIGTWGSNGNGEGQFLHFSDLVVDEDGTAYVPDDQKNQILVFKQK